VILESLEERTRQRHRLQNNAKVLLKGKGNCRHHKRKNCGLWTDGTEAPIFVQSVICRMNGKWQEKPGQSLQEGLG
jgi:hypothetical protein